MTPEEINKMLASRIHEVCKILLPGAKVRGNDYEVGSVNGEEGESMLVAHTGEHLGGYIDFDGSNKGDLINLWCSAKGILFPDAMKEIKSFLGVSDDYTGTIKKLTKSGRNPKKLNSLPKYDLVSEVPEWSKYIGKRKISEHTALKYKIGVYKNKLFFPHFHNDGPIMWHTRSYKKDDSGKYILSENGKPKKDFQTNKNPLYCLWGWDGIENSDREVVITEGRIDALSYIEQGIKALSVPCGGGKGAKQSWIDFDYHNLIDHFDKIYISMDKDSAGEDALEEISTRLGEHLCWFVELPNGHKDANDAHIAGVDLNKCLTTAKQNMPEGVHKAGEFHDDIIEYFYPKDEMAHGMYLPWEKCSGYMAREGEVTIIAGENGSGKTQFVGNIMLAGFDQGKVFGIASMEMSPKMLLGRLSKQASASHKPSPEYIKVINDHFNKWLWIYKKKGVANKELILKSFLYLNKRYGVKYFIIDSLAKCGINEDDYNSQKNFIDELEAFADDNQCHIFLVHHIRKTDQKNYGKPPGKSDIKGTGAITDMVDNIILFWRNRVKEDFFNDIKTDFEDEKEKKKYDAKAEKLRRKGDAVAIIDKQRNGDWEGKVPLWFNKSCYQFLSSKDSSPHRFVKYSKLEN